MRCHAIIFLFTTKKKKKKKKGKIAALELKAERGYLAAVRVGRRRWRKPLVVAELRGLWAKQKMQSRQMKIRVTVKHKTLKNAAPDTFSSVTQDKFAARDALAQ